MQLGAFDLVEECGRGAMGVVYRATHARWGTPVAVKVLPKAAEDPALLDAFHSEIRALTRLDHPHIARVFDHGLVGADTPDFAEGSPWFAMEYCGGRLVDDARTMASWHDLIATLSALLSALATAHAHGVVHRDLKFSNLLLARPGDLRPGLKLVDFGVALLDARGTSSHSAGTPLYMPPEQWTHGVAATGPWTDIFAVGVLAWKLATAISPYEPHTSGDALLAVQRSGDPGPFRPRFAVPSGLEAWLDACMAPETSARFQSAADALYALKQLESEPRSIALPTPGGLEQRAPPQRAPMAPVPDQWRTRTPPLPPMELTGAGLSLVALREPEFLGRHEERDRLWRGLVDADRGAPTRVALVGNKGVGASSLGRWLVRQANTRSGAHAVTVRGSTGDRPGAAVRRLVEQALRVGETDPGARQIQGQRALDRAQVAFSASHRALESALTDQPTVQRQRHGAALAILGALAKQRLLVVLFDDVHHDPDLEAFVTAAADRLEGRTMLLLRGEGSAPEGWLPLEVNPLPDKVMHEALRYLVPLEPETSRQVVEHAHGHPARAVRMVQRLARIDRLDLTAHGFQLRGRLRLKPTDTAPVLDDLTATERDRLMRAAILGPTVNRSVWLAACEGLSGGRGPQELEQVWIREGLALSGAKTWVFAQSAMIASLTDALNQAPSASEHYAACAAALAGHDPVKEGRCWIAAGDLEKGLRVWIEARDQISDERGARAELALVREALELAAELPLQEDLHGELWNQEVTGMRVLGNFDIAQEAAKGRLQDALQQDWPLAAAKASWNLGTSLFNEPTKAIPALRRGLEILGPTPAPYIRGLLHFRTCNSLLMLGQNEEAAVEGKLALESFQAAGTPQALQYASRTGYMLASAQLDLPATLFHARRALELAREHRPSTVPGALVRLGETLTQAGALEEADQVLREAQDLARVHGGGRTLTDAVANSMVCAARRGLWTEVRTYGETALQLERGHHLDMCCSLFLAVSFCHARRRSTAEGFLDAVWTWLEGPHRFESDVIFALDALTAVARERGWEPLAERASHFARQERATLSPPVAP